MVGKQLWRKTYKFLSPFFFKMVRLNLCVNEYVVGMISSLLIIVILQTLFISLGAEMAFIMLLPMCMLISLLLSVLVFSLVGFGHLSKDCFFGAILIMEICCLFQLVYSFAGLSREFLVIVPNCILIGVFMSLLYLHAKGEIEIDFEF